MNFHYFRDYLKELYEFNDFIDSRMGFQDIHDFRNYQNAIP